MEGGLGNAHNE